MPPLRRYLRLTPRSIIETHIYFESPSDALPFVQNPNHPLFQRLMQAVRPIIIPKLREERAAVGKGRKKRKAIKDVVIHGQYELSVFLVDISRHAVIVRSKTLPTDPKYKPRDATQAGSSEALDQVGQETIEINEEISEDDAFDSAARDLLKLAGDKARSQDRGMKKKSLVTVDYSQTATIFGKGLVVAIKDNGPPESNPRSNLVLPEAPPLHDSNHPEQSKMSNWIASTQRNMEDGDEDEDDGEIVLSS